MSVATCLRKCNSMLYRRDTISHVLSSSKDSNSSFKRQRYLSRGMVSLSRVCVASIDASIDCTVSVPREDFQISSPSSNALTTCVVSS